ncbi:hypothetical protein [Paenibacillus sp. ACRRY]|uniref:hypothetical protein n=1 Tax=Paenibacillus sp. ACRRY TaxID=2918208 RepID=UPI001EF48F4A|nr:hypothetical protein [Paenibacillus sp. ACRRY]MCG7385099.1 hypothetical protein [Paenibacillus sp. ACRRY]
MFKYKVLGPVIFGGVIVNSGEIELDETKGARLVERGILEEVEAEEETDINKMKVDQLKDYAEKNGIDLGDAKGKPEILKAIKEAEAVANANTTS